MEQGKACCPADPGDSGSDPRGYNKTDHAAHAVEAEVGAKMALDQPRNKDSLGCVAQSKNNSGRKTAVTEQVGRDGRRDNASGHRQARLCPECNHNPRGDTRSGPEHSHAIGFCQ